mmetsp:Transcript_16600/g.42458  ORF Transcript_16600/g.42458 Transcript_16600/m.42458 type:complete len:375 (+) Transcript_16600:64-1188(+)
MGSFGQVLCAFLVGLVAIVAYIAYNLVALSAFTSPPVVPALQCVKHKMEGLWGCEAVNIDYKTHTAILSCDTGRREWFPPIDKATVPAAKATFGRLFSIDLTTPGSKPRPMALAGFEGEFSPHGMSLWRDDRNNTLFLFVVNHRYSGSGVDIFRVAEDFSEATFLSRVQDPLLPHPNDVVAVGPASFYVTNQHYFPPGSLLRMVEILLALPLVNVVYVHEGKATVALDGFRVANGIDMSVDGEMVYIADSVAGAVVLARRSVETGALARVGQVDVGAGLDNVRVDKDTGVVTAAAMYRGLDFAWRVDHAGHPVPSAVVQLTPQTDYFGHNYKVSHVFTDDGTYFSTCTGTAHDSKHGRLLLVGLLDDGLLDCKL